MAFEYTLEKQNLAYVQLQLQSLIYQLIQYCLLVMVFFFYRYPCSRLKQSSMGHIRRSGRRPLLFGTPSCWACVDAPAITASP